jgi:uncharacterized phiE125 gp8 family phage protein
MGLTMSVPPTHEPVSLEQIRTDRRVTDESEESYMMLLNAAARSYVEGATTRQLVDATYVFTLDTFPTEIRLPRPPLDSVTSVQYIDTDGATQTLAASVYTVLTDDLQEGRITLAYDQTWPTTRDVPNAVTVTFVAGYGTEADVPATFKKSILLLVGEMFEQRETIVTSGVVKQVPTLDRLLWLDRVVQVV